MRRRWCEEREGPVSFHNAVKPAASTAVSRVPNSPARLATETTLGAACIPGGSQARVHSRVHRIGHCGIGMPAYGPVFIVPQLRPQQCRHGGKTYEAERRRVRLF